MSPAPEPTRTRHQPLPGAGSERHADVIDIRPGPPTRHPTRTDSGVDPWPDTVVLGRWVPHPGPAPESAARRPDSPIADPAMTMSIFDDGGLRDRLVSRRERHYSEPPPPRAQHPGRLLSSLVIAGGGVLSVLIAGDIGGVPVVATTALVATIVCGAILVAAQLTQEIGRARARRAPGVRSALEDRPAPSRSSGRRSSAFVSRRRP